MDPMPARRAAGTLNDWPRPMAGRCPSRCAPFRLVLLGSRSVCTLVLLAAKRVTGGASRLLAAARGLLPDL